MRAGLGGGEAVATPFRRFAYFIIAFLMRSFVLGSLYIASSLVRLALVCSLYVPKWERVQFYHGFITPIQRPLHLSRSLLNFVVI